jgi:hypothetical protein
MNDGESALRERKAQERRERADRVIDKMLHWALWAAFMGIAAPLLLLAVLYGMFKQKIPTGFELVGRGELFILNLVLLTSSLSEIRGKHFDRSQKRLRRVADIADVFLLLLILVSVVLWSAITTQGVSSASNGELPSKIPNWEYPSTFPSWIPTWGATALVIASGLLALVTVGLAALAREDAS